MVNLSILNRPVEELRTKVGVEGVNFTINFWSDKSTKCATDDGKNNFQFALFDFNLLTLKKKLKIFSTENLKKRTRGGSP